MFLHFLGSPGLVVFAAIVPTAGDRHASSTVMTTPEEWCERALLRSLDQEVRPAMLTVTAERARAEAAAGARRRRTRTARSDLDGVPITWKDVFDVEGTVTTAGSVSRSGYPRAAVDSRLVRRAGDLGLVTVGKTNLSEFAFSGLGVNEHFGTPPNPNDAALVPGGSSAGAAVAVTAGVAPLAVGTDTSGSVRVPAAFCGCVGFRASKHRYGPDDFVPLSPTLDSVGILAETVEKVMALDRLLAVEARRNTFCDNPIRLVVPVGEWVEDCTAGVRRLFDVAIGALRDRGIAIDTVRLTALSDAQRLMDTHGTIVGAEAYARYGRCLSTSAAIQPATRRRLRHNAGIATTVPAVRSAMPSLRRRISTELAGAVLLCPTVRHEPPPLVEVLASDDRHDASNASTLRTTMVSSFLGMCSISLPLRGPDGRSTVGLMASLPHGDDHRLLAVASRLTEYLGSQ
jgi:aspartyl-tRNA(Asn)/glutamyl-tRNA(Gln) amidotransferase subunit A